MPTPFFIVGSGRCGSTWLYSVLRNHHELALTNEAKALDFLYFMNELAAVPSNEVREFFTNESFRMRGLVRDEYVKDFVASVSRHSKAICEDFYRTHFAGQTYTYWGDKLPDPRAATTARWVWPDARYLVLVRDPRDVLCSWRAFAQRQTIARDDPKLVGLTAESLANTWQRLYSGVREQLDSFLLLRYEDLRQDPRQHIGAIIDYLGLAWTEALDTALCDDATFDSHGTASTPQATIGRWRSELAADDIAKIETVCGTLMLEFGYS